MSGLQSDGGLKVSRIENGIVIDHIPAGRGLKCLSVLGLQNPKGSIIVAINVPSKRQGRKDIVKLENISLADRVLNKLALIAPAATINIIKDGAVVGKKHASCPAKVSGIVRCNNERCASRNERDARSSFSLESSEPLVLRCDYCERTLQENEILEQISA